MEALVCAFSELRIREDAVSLTLGCPGSADTPPNIYEGGLGARRQQCPSPPGSKPKNFRLRHLRSLALYLPSSMQPAGQCESHWLGRLMAGGCLPRVGPLPKGGAWALELPGPLSSTNHPLDSPGPQPPRENLGSTASSSSTDPTKGALSQPRPPEGSGSRPKRSWGALEESTCPMCKRTRPGAQERP
ncbi:uncharacterized protein C16orf90 homolog isoform X1 [Monodelphis domestica]|nr:uncharacterized protein C16orf90 homolog isoform X1 [Monodelphis domestica]XP_044513107.1 uncharacterized protein C16orf90 homolog [Gracilinanus agilis]